LKIGVFVERGQFGPELQVQVIVPHQPFFVSKNQDKRSIMRYKNVGISFFRFVTIHALTDRRGQTDGQRHRQTFRSWLRSPCIDAAGNETKSAASNDSWIQFSFCVTSSQREQK